MNKYDPDSKTVVQTLTLTDVQNLFKSRLWNNNECYMALKNAVEYLSSDRFAEDLYNQISINEDFLEIAEMAVEENDDPMPMDMEYVLLKILKDGLENIDPNETTLTCLQNRQVYVETEIFVSTMQVNCGFYIDKNKNVSLDLSVMVTEEA